MITIGIIGNGFVGNATSQFENENVKVLIYDVSPEKCKPPALNLQLLSENSDIIFICVPTPMSSCGACHLGIIESVIESLLEVGVDFNKKPVVIRSTVPVGTSNKFNCFFMPEFLTEANARLDFKNTECWIFGRKDNTKEEQNINFMKLTREILNTNVTSGNIENEKSLYVETKEAEAIKLFKNTFLAVKVGFCNEFFRFCQGNNVDYDKVIKGVITDSRITESHTRVPGNSGKFGFGGTCFPKDIASLQYQMKNLDILSPIVNATIERNNTIDRVEQDWKGDEGRAFINN
jgi:nucleotide sugar dehydrogenase